MSGGKGGGGGDQTVTSEPWGPSQKYLEDALGLSQSLFQQGSPGSYEGQRVAEMNPYQTGGIDWMAQRAIQGNPLNALGQQGLAQQIAGVPNPTYGFYGQTMQNPLAGAGQALPFAYGDIAQAQGMNPAMAMLGQTAGGGFLNANPYLDQTFSNAAQNLGEQYRNYVVPSFEGAQTLRGGAQRPGEPVSAPDRFYRGQLDVGLGRGLADLATNIYGRNYATERQNQLGAQGQIGSFYNQGLGLQQQATGQLGNLGASGLQGQLAGASGLGGQFGQDLNRQLQAIGMAPGQALSDYADIGSLLSAGGMLQDQRQREITGDQAGFQEEFYGPGSPQQWLDDYIRRVGGVGSMGGTQQTDVDGGGNIFGDLLGLGLGAAGIAGSFGWNPFAGAAAAGATAPSVLNSSGFIGGSAFPGQMRIMG